MRHKEANKKTGFTLIEIMVAVSIFSVVMLMSVGSILSVFDASQKSKNLRSVMDNINLTLESMTRTIRFGTNYHCDITSGDPTSPLDCEEPGGDTITLLSSDGVQVTYSISGGRIVKSILGVEYPITSPDITITKLMFRVYGSPTYNNGLDTYQPQVILVVGGYVGAKETTRSSFIIETAVSQRKLDFE